MHKKVFWITLALAIPLGGVGYILLSAFTTSLPAAGQQVLAEYLTYADPEGARVDTIARALAPQALTSDTSGDTFGNGYYFTLSVDLTSGSRTGSSGRPLPYPPDELWCVRLAAATHPYPVVLVAYHSDLYVGTWVVHQLPDTDGAHPPDLAALQCQWPR